MMLDGLHPREELLRAKLVARVLPPLTPLAEMVEDRGEACGEGSRRDGLELGKGSCGSGRRQFSSEVAESSRPVSCVLACYVVVVERVHGSCLCWNALGIHLCHSNEFTAAAPGQNGRRNAVPGSTFEYHRPSPSTACRAGGGRRRRKLLGNYFQ
jgi:hypothetical protein